MREFGSEFPAVSLPDAYFDMITQKYVTAVYLRSGREALGYVAENIEDKRKVILLPAYGCESMVTPFTNRQWDVFYYSLNKDLTANNLHLQTLIEQHSPTAVLVMNYFGVAFTNMAIETIKSINQDIIVIEDFTHCLFSFEGIYNLSVDYYVASIRKWFGVNDGALVLSNKNMIFRPSYHSNSFVELRKEAQKEKFRYAVDRNTEIKTNYRNKLIEAEKQLNNSMQINAISEKSLMSIRACCSEDIIVCRSENAKHLYDNIQCSHHLRFPDNIESSFLNCPFSLPILVDNQAEVQECLASQGLYASVLWPIDEMARRICKYSTEMSDSMLSLPIDQRYDYDDIETMSTIILSTLDALK